jgi:hypothetical protein
MSGPVAAAGSDLQADDADVSNLRAVSSFRNTTAYCRALKSRLQSRLIDDEDRSLILLAPLVVSTAYDRQFRRASGIFFTHQHAAKMLVDRVKDSLSAGRQVIDPTMGAGDLLLESARHLPKARSIAQTVKLWSSLLEGYDLNGPFLDLAKLRLALLARHLHHPSSTVDAAWVLQQFSGFRRADVFSANFSTFDHGALVLANPPFQQFSGAANGKQCSPRNASVAALVLEKLVLELPGGSDVVGIFPEVLRCGSSYERLRRRVSQSFDVVHEQSIGRFDSMVDIDVFVAHYSARPDRRLVAAHVDADQPISVDAFCDVSIGDVVPHRHAESGPWCRYVTAHDVPAWAERHEPRQSRRWRGRTFEPPFVVIRRTSSTRQRYRTVASIIVGNRRVAVENHLMVLRPKDGSLKTCWRVFKALRHPEVNLQLNDSMRCRHLTKSSLARLRLRL